MAGVKKKIRFGYVRIIRTLDVSTEPIHMYLGIKNTYTHIIGTS